MAAFSNPFRRLALLTLAAGLLVGTVLLTASLDSPGPDRISGLFEERFDALAGDADAPDIPDDVRQAVVLTTDPGVR